MRLLRLVIGVAAAWSLCVGSGGCDSSSGLPDLDGADGVDGGEDGVDGGEDGVDGGEDGQDGADGTDGGPTAGGPTRFSVTSGGGEAEGAGYKVRLHVGAPQPMGSASGASGSVEAGPGARP
ncbi:MAG TPA: hypothetical protein PK668_20700 [Myxococcota bacterium]|nr:hypothetical protein [Myxococcota bacterium]HRY96668.1 hypothetical protein [Myxococcota bacterium]